MSEPVDTLSAARFLELMRHQRTLYRRLRFLAERQQALVCDGAGEALLSVLAERQRLVDGLMGLGARLAPYREHWTEFYASLDEVVRHEVAEMLEEVNQSLGLILQSDSRDSALLTARKQAVADELSGCGAAGRASAAYAAARSGSAGLADEEA